MDVDGTLCPLRRPNQSYSEIEPDKAVLVRLLEYRRIGFYVIINTSRNMNTYDGNLGLISANTLPVLVDWLRRHGVPFDEVHVGKPWPGRGGFTVDDKSIRPAEFTTLSYDEILALVGNG